MEMSDNLNGKNGIQVTVNDDHKSVTVQMFLDGQYKAWVEFDAEQLDSLIQELVKSRAALRGEGL